jgi:ABC-type sugar transport system ATPase subunit
MEQTMADDSMLLTMKGISKTFPGVQALDNVDFSLRAGKSTPCWARTARASPR